MNNIMMPVGPGVPAPPERDGRPEKFIVSRPQPLDKF